MIIEAQSPAVLDPNRIRTPPYPREMEIEMAGSAALPASSMRPFNPRRVLLLDQGRVWRNGEYGVPYKGPQAHSFPGFWQWLEGLGYYPEDVAGYSVHPDTGVLTLTSRNLQWKSLPVVSKPRFEYTVEGQAVYERGVAERADLQVVNCDGVSVKISFANSDPRALLSPHVITSAEIVVIDLWVVSDRELRKQTCVFDPLSEEELPSFYIAHAGSISGVPSKEILRLRTKFEAQERFHASHLQNASIFMGRALHHLPTETPLRASWMESTIATDNSHYSVFGDPLALHILFETAAKGVSDVDEWVNPAQYPSSSYWDHWKEMHASMIHASGHVEGVSADGNPRFVWRGSGKYRPLIVEDGFELNRINGLYYNLHNLGLLSLKADKTLSITDLGLKLTRYFGRSGNDPDVLLRWRTEDGTNGTVADIPAMDRWLNRFLRETKRKVADLKPFVYTEQTGAGGPVRSWTRYAFGGYLDFAELDLNEEEKQRLVQWLDEADARATDQSWWALSHGAVRNYDRAGLCNRIGLWYGCPLGIGPSWAKEEPATLPYMEARAEAAFQSLPEWLKVRFQSGPQIVSVGATHERRFTLLENWEDDPVPRPSEEWKKFLADSKAIGRSVVECSASPIVRGWRIPIDDVSVFDARARGLLGQMRTQRTTPRDGRYFTFTLAESGGKTYAIIGFMLWAPGWARSSWASSLSYYARPLVQHIREHYAPLLGHRLADGIKTWNVDEASGTVQDIEFDDDRIKEIDALFAEPMPCGRDRPSF